MSRRIVAPVVVNPDIDSKKASVRLSIDPVVKKGRHPKNVKLIQQRLTRRKPSFVVNSLGLEPKGHTKPLKIRIPIAISIK